MFAPLALALALAAPAAAQSLSDAGDPIVIGRSHVLVSAVMGEQRRINVMTPPGYDAAQAAGRRYPVLYLLDGGVEEQDFLHIAGLLHQGGLWGIHEPVILVGVESRDRRAELTTPSSDPAEQKDFPSHGQSERFRRFLVEEVKPAVAASFRTSRVSALMGESLAGYFVVDTALRHGEDFDRYIAVSPSLWWSRGELAKAAPRHLAGGTGAQRLWLSIADEGGEMRAGMDRLVAALGAQSRVAWTYRPMPQETHGAIYHPAATQAVREVFPPSKAP